MSFESSSSEGSSSSSSSGESHAVDDTLVYEVRCALQLAVGRICRDEDDDTGEEERGCRRVEVTNEAIKALTDLTYHFASSSLSNDVVAFSKHGRRQTVKTDDVLLVCRKNKHVMKELKTIVAENPDVYSETAKKSRSTTSKRGNLSKKKPSKSKAAKKQHSQKQPASSSSSESSGDELLNGKLNKKEARRHKRASSFDSSLDSSDSEIFPSRITNQSKKSQTPKSKRTDKAATGLGSSGVKSKDLGDSTSDTMVVDLCDD